MGIINSYDMKILISGDQKVLNSNTYTLIRVKNEEHVYKSIGYSSPFYLRVEKSDGERNNDELEFLFLSEKEKLSHKMTRSWNIIENTEISKELDNYQVLSDRNLFYQVSFIESYGDVEKTIREHFFGQILNLRSDEYNMLYDDYFDVKIFLREIGPQSITSSKWVRPIDIRNLSVNHIVLQQLKKCSEWYLEPDMDDFVTKFATVSDEIQAQYFLTRFHSNTLWSLNPVCILCFRLSAFVLPGYMTAELANGLPKKKIVRDNSDGAKYAIDSIHFNSDICFDIEELNDLIDGHYYDISLA